MQFLFPFYHYCISLPSLWSSELFLHSTASRAIEHEAVNSRTHSYSHEVRRMTPLWIGRHLLRPVESQPLGKPSFLPRKTSAPSNNFFAACKHNQEAHWRRRLFAGR